MEYGIIMLQHEEAIPLDNDYNELICLKMLIDQYNVWTSLVVTW